MNASNTIKHWKLVQSATKLKIMPVDVLLVLLQYVTEENTCYLFHTITFHSSISVL